MIRWWAEDLGAKASLRAIELDQANQALAANAEEIYTPSAAQMGSQGEPLQIFVPRSDKPDEWRVNRSTIICGGGGGEVAQGRRGQAGLMSL